MELHLYWVHSTFVHEDSWCRHGERRGNREVTCHFRQIQISTQHMQQNLMEGTCECGACADFRCICCDAVHACHACIYAHVMLSISMVVDSILTRFAHKQHIHDFALQHLAWHFVNNSATSIMGEAALASHETKATVITRIRYISNNSRLPPPAGPAPAIYWQTKWLKSKFIIMLSKCTDSWISTLPNTGQKSPPSRVSKLGRVYREQSQQFRAKLYFLWIFSMMAVPAQLPCTQMCTYGKVKEHSFSSYHKAYSCSDKLTSNVESDRKLFNIISSVLTPIIHNLYHKHTRTNSATYIMPSSNSLHSLLSNSLRILHTWKLKPEGSIYPMAR